jgi:prepilin-type N-terminal cleavage/methylation domain-containing protein/prepilin-type processing-associated H-X9-DG protein
MSSEVETSLTMRDFSTPLRFARNATVFNLFPFVQSHASIVSRKHMIRNESFSGGFTVIELLVVITVIVVLASIAFPAYTGVQERARVVQDMNNLRQLGLATQMYMNDNDGVIFDATATWMGQLHPKYLGAWKIFQSPFDQRSPSENNTNAPVSYGLNGHNVAGMLADKITNPSAFIVFAPAQTSANNIAFSGTAGTAAPGVTVYKNTSAPGGSASTSVPHGTHNGRKRINAVFADWHSDNISWTNFVNDQKTTADPSGDHRWDP